MRYVVVFSFLSLFFITRLMAQSVLPVLENNGFYSFTVANVCLTVNPAYGARITSLKVAGEEILFWDDNTTLLSGSTFWPSPQNIWGWPPSETLDAKPYSASVTGNSLEMESDIDYGLNVKFGKRITATRVDTSISIIYSIENTGSEPVSLAPWEVTRVPASGITFFEKGDGNLTGDMVANTSISHNCVWYNQDSTSSANANKFFSDGRGWLAHVAPSKILFIKKFDDIPLGSSADVENEIEVYTSSSHSYTELENQGRYKEISPGAVYTWKVKWYVRQLPGGMEIHSGNNQLVSYAKSVLASDSLDVPYGIKNEKTVDAPVTISYQKGKLNVSFNTTPAKALVVNIFNLQGNRVFAAQLLAKNNTFIVNNLKKGCYLYQLTGANKLISKGKLVAY